MSPRTGPRVQGSELDADASAVIDLAGGRRDDRETHAEVAEREVERVNRPRSRTRLAERGERDCLDHAADMALAVHVHGAGDAVDEAPRTGRMREAELVPGTGPAGAGRRSFIDDLGAGFEQREKGL